MKKRPTIAILYDFDKTLCTKDMQEYTFIPNVGLKPAEFWSLVDKLKKEKRMDGILAYLYMMLKKAKEAGKSVTREEFVKLGKGLKLQKGVKEWFGRINEFGEENGVRIEHYIISSGLREIIEGSEIYDCFKEVFACEFLYDENNVACWPKNAVNYTTKTQFLFRINKGVPDLSDDVELNRYVSEDERSIPFRNMIYIGDGLTDVPCMKLVKVNGGYSIAVYPNGKKRKVEELLLDRRVDAIVKADYSEDSELDRVVKDVIRKMEISDSLIRLTMEQTRKIR